MTKIFLSNSTLNKSKFLRLQLNLMGPFNDSILLVKIVGDIPRSSPGSSILDMPRHEKKDFNFTSLCATTVFFEIHFHRRIPMIYGRNSCLSHNYFLLASLYFICTVQIKKFAKNTHNDIL